MAPFGAILAILATAPAEAAAARLAATCSFTEGCAVAVDGAPWSVSNITKTRAKSSWCSSADGSLLPRKTEQVSGSDTLGAYTGTALLWSCGGVPFETSVRHYSLGAGEALIFAQRWPTGAQDTALGPPKVPGPGGPQEQVISAFPSIAAAPGTAPQNYMVVYNQMVGGMADGSEYGSWPPTTATTTTTREDDDDSAGQTPQNCSGELLPGVDFNGGDIQRTTAATPAACCRLCRDHPSCAVFTWYSDRDGTVHCGLKSHIAKRLINQQDHTSGICRGGVKAPTTGVKSGTMAGPMLFMGGGEGKGTGGGSGSSSLVLAPATHAMEMNLYWEASTNTLQAGLLGSITDIPANYTSETMLYLGADDSAGCAPHPPGGPNCAVRGWGQALRAYKNKDLGSKWASEEDNGHYSPPHGFPAGGTAVFPPGATWSADPTLSHLGYYSDNGAYYYYFTGPPPPPGGEPSNFGTVFEAVKQVEVTENRIPLRYLQIDSYWYFKGSHGGVVNWTATPTAFPDGLAKLSKDTGWKYTAHNRYWGSDVAYAKQNGGKYDFIVEKSHGKSIPTTQAFWNALMNSSKAWGMAVYEQDWLHNEWEGLSATLSSATLSTSWLKQMGAGASQAGVWVQYCMAYGRHLLASVEVPAVNQV